MGYRPLDAAASAQHHEFAEHRTVDVPGGPEFDEPLAVVAVGPAGGGRTEVLGALLGVGPAALRVPQGSFLVVRPGAVADGLAYLPDRPEPYPYRAEPVGAGPALARPPRRVEMTLPDRILRHFAVVDTPDTGALGPAGARVLLDAISRAGAVLFVISAEQTLSAAELELLTTLAAYDVAVFFAVTPAAGGDDDRVHTVGEPYLDQVSVALDAHRATLLATVPALAAARWFAVDPAAGDTVPLRWALVDWASTEGLRRASGNPPVVPGSTRAVRVRPDLTDFDWADLLDRQVRTWAPRVRQHLALEVANIHLRCVQELLFATGCGGLPATLDREIQALSLYAVVECDTGVDQVLDEIITRVFQAPEADDVRRRLVAAVRLELANHRTARGLDRVLLVTAAGRVIGRTGSGGVGPLLAYPGASGTAVLPPIGVALAGGCYQHWRGPDNADPTAARSWLQRVLREVELEVSREVNRRFEALRSALVTVLTDTVEHSTLLG
ncbi:hypothetical protein GCM10027280_27270 [Micromonospora polyrhachis]|uniref:Dynamin family protein n=1 Tax=Micromonospora polyrhachis TaxID=1282883 RepID=A0A7W7SN38_9ACTN|nr:hypothetical protein [Micromonospora polyrhachis]MBB4957819.1 hypothetical protein [Micromonospora polyrhachis]